MDYIGATISCTYWHIGDGEELGQGSNVEGNRWLQQRFMCDTLSLERSRVGETERERQRDGRLVLELNQTVSWCWILPEATEGGREGGWVKGEQSNGERTGTWRRRRIMMEEAKRLKEWSGWWSSWGRKQHRQSRDTVEIGRLLYDVTDSVVAKEELFQASRNLEVKVPFIFCIYNTRWYSWDTSKVWSNSWNSPAEC